MTEKKAAKVRLPKKRLTLAEVMEELEASGSAQTRKTYTRHGAVGPLFGVSFATLKSMTKRIDVDHQLALELWKTGNFDARNLAVKIVEPHKLTSTQLSRWIREGSQSSICGGYVAMLPAETPFGEKLATKWIASKNDGDRIAGWILVGQLAMRDEALTDAYFKKRLVEIQKSIHKEANEVRESMNRTLIMIGCRSVGFRALAITAARKIGRVVVDHGQTSCKTPDAEEYIEKSWAHSKSKGFESPAAHERTREVPRRRC